MNGNLEAVELSEADKLLNEQLLEEARKASKHRSRKLRRSGSGGGSLSLACGAPGKDQDVRARGQKLLEVGHLVWHIEHQEWVRMWWLKGSN